MKPINQNVLKAPFSGIRKMFNLAYGMKDTISFSVGEPDFTAAERIVEAANHATQMGWTKYTPNAGLLELREKIAKDLEKNECKYDPQKEIIVTVGGMDALYSALTVILNAGDEVIITEPYWPNYPSQIQLVGGTPRYVKVEEKNGFIYDPEVLEKAVNSKTKAIIINSPANPTGGVIDIETLKAISEIAIHYDLYVISDEVYQKFIFDNNKHFSIATLPGMKERTIICNSFSKTYAMTGWRVGYAAGPNEIIGQMVKCHESTISCVNSAAQYGAIAALDGNEAEFQKLRETFDRRRHLVVEGLNSIDGITCIWPKGAFYAFPCIKEIGINSEEFAVNLLRETGVVLVPGTAFGEAGEGYVRISYATSDENIIEGIERIRRFVERIPKNNA